MRKAQRTTTVGLFGLALCLGLSPAVQADRLVNFQFNEGSGGTTTDAASGLVGVFGIAQDPSTDTVQLTDSSPSGQAGDRSITTAGLGFLIADDSEGRILNITNGPITLESWVFIDPATPAGAAEGTIAYGSSYKMGLRSGLQVFTLFGIVDVVNNAAGPIPAGEWVHLAAAWEPGTGVHFYVNGVESFEPDTTPAARPVTHHYLSLASEGLANNMIATFDRMRIHHALLTAEQIDSVATAPKAPLPTTLVSYDFNQSALPATNSLAPALPASLSSGVIPALTGPAWTNDTPSGQPDDFALAFLSTNPPVKEVVTVDLASASFDLGLNSTSYTLQAWVKLPTERMDDRRVIYRTDGPAPRISLSINANRTLHTTVLGTADFTTSVGVPNDNRWHHIAVVMEDFARLRFYLDGVLRQTVNRTQTGAPSSGGSPRLLIGKESETRFFRGVLDRVIIDNTALAATELDFPAVPGLARFESLASHPADVITNLGANVTLTANPTSPTAASYQWVYRSNAADPVGTPIAGATGTSLTLNNLAPANIGFYSLVVSNQAGVVESYPAEVLLQSDYELPPTGFEAPAYTSGPLDGQKRWTVDQNHPTVQVLTRSQITNVLEASGLNPGETVHSGDQALFVGGAGLASTVVRRIMGMEDQTQVTFDIWVRPLSPGNTGFATGNTFLTLENSAGTRAAAFRLGPANSIDYGTAISGVWQATGLTWEDDTWYRITMEVDYATKTYNFSVNGTRVNTEPIPFYTATADRLTQIRIFRGASQAGAIFDDLSFGGAVPGAPELEVAREGGQVVISWPAGDEGFTLQATDELVPANWTPVAHTTEGGVNRAVIDPTGAHRFFRLAQ